MMTTIACEEKDKQVFDLLKAQHAVKTNKNISQPEFVSLLLEKWRDKI